MQSTLDPASATPLSAELVGPGLEAHTWLLTFAQGATAQTVFTRGLAQWGHPELALTLLASPQDPVAALGRSLVAALGQQASAGKRVSVGGASTFARGLGGVAAWLGLGYVPPIALAGVPLPQGALTAVALLGEEAAVVLRVGALRVAARLAARLRHWPSVALNDLGRAPVASAQEETVLTQTPLRACPGAWATVTQDNRALCCLPRDPALAQDLARLAPDAGFGLFLEPAPDADGLLVWSPGQREASAVALPGATGQRLAAHFVAVGIDGGAGRVLLVEDGVGLVLSREDYARLRHALHAQVDFDARPAGSEYSFSLRWR